MDLHEQERLRNIAWLNANIGMPETKEEKEAREKRSKELREEITPDTIIEETIRRHKSENLLSGEWTYSDVLYDKDIISYQDWKKSKENG